uniref:Uncharacterized protein n=1 Tax=Arundo donax TaxID=35708 RepID=A0A0A9DV25_ARUDO
MPVTMFICERLTNPAPVTCSQPIYYSCHQKIIIIKLVFL